VTNAGEQGMAGITTTSLQECITRHRDAIPGLEKLAASAETDSLRSRIDRYEQCYPLLEKALWSGTADFDPLLDCYQSLFREHDALVRQQAASAGDADQRYHYILSIPVADRPSHLRTCLESIYQVCERFGYGGKTEGVYARIRVIVAEDSREEHNIRQHIELVEAYRRKGLQVFHFGQDEQYELLQSIPAEDRQILAPILTTQPRDRFYLKGQAANRNLSVLKCLQLTEDRNRTLYYFVDSDESLCVNRQAADGEQRVYAVNYFHCIDRIFRTTDTLCLTGKLVGDPPVSPAVMAANFLDDVTAFFARLAKMRGADRCRFHDAMQASTADTASGAAYHDMAGLFGFESRHATFPYRCPLQGKHDHAACLRAFSGRLAAFFFGEHLTRKMFFSYGDGFSALTPARTVYPGNYIVNYDGLKYIIPFGHLRLRMSGPTAGRLIAAEIHDRFASVNLPHLHRRTNESGLGEAFRPGVRLTETDEQATIDLSNEFERQFFGDLMLFTTETLVIEADVLKSFEKDIVVRIMERKEHELLAQYRQKHDAILEKTARFGELVFSARHWWLDDPGLAGALRQVRAFLNNIYRNFSEQSAAWLTIQSSEHRAGRKQQILEALMNYRTARDAWDRLF
jgi:hypothetical protein